MHFFTLYKALLIVMVRWFGHLQGVFLISFLFHFFLAKLKKKKIKATLK